MEKDKRMEKDKNAITEQLLNLTLEIVYLLTGEDYIIVKKPRGQAPHNRLQVVEGICRSWGNVLLEHSDTPQEDNALKILDLTNKVIELLMGEVPIRYQDVAVYFSMEEWEYVKGHKDLYQDMMDDQRPRTSHDGPMCGNSPPHNAASDLVNEDDIAMDTDSETESLNTQDPEDMQNISSETITEKESGYDNGKLSDVDDTQHFSCIRIKDEPCDDSWDGEDLLDTSTYSAGQLHIKEEPASCDEEDLIDTIIYNPPDHLQHHHYPHIMEEPVTQPNMYISKGPLVHDIEEPASCDRGDPDIYGPTDHTQQHPGHIMGEPTLSNKEDHNDTTLPIRMKKGPGRTQSKIRRYPKRRSASRLVKPREPTLHNGRKYEKTQNTVMEPPAAQDVSGLPQTDDNTENSSSVYSVRQGTDTMEILYHCPSCHKGFHSNLELARHQVIHTVDKLFICSLCGKSFTELSFLIKHQVIHTDLKLCVCPVCGGCFYSETSLAKHKKSHSLPSFCSKCSQCFFDKRELEIHERKHAGKRTFACHLCGKQFIARSVLNKHMSTHTQPKLPK